MNIGSIFKNIADGVGTMLGKKSGEALTKSDFFDADDYNGSGFFRSTETMAPSDYYTGWGHTGISTIANHVASLEKVLENDKGDPIKNNPIFDMLKFEMLRDLVSFLEIHGRGYVWKITDPKGRTVLGVEVLNPKGVKAVKWSGNSGRFGVRYYEYKHDNIKWIIQPENIIVFTYFHPLQAYPYNQDRGMSGLAASDFVIDADRKSDIWNGKIFDNSGYAGNVLQTEQALTPEVTKRIADKWDNDHKGIKNGHKTAVLTHGLKQAEGKTQKDMDFSKMKESARDVILGRLKMPKSVI